MAAEHFEFDRFYATLDAVRSTRDVTWRQVSREAGVSASSLTRMRQGSRPDVETVASLAAWAGLDVAAFFPATKSTEDTLESVTAYLHRDPNLTAEAASALERLVLATYAQLAARPDQEGYRS